MSVNLLPYTIIAEAHVNKWDNALQTAVPGWEVTARWNDTGTIIPVFVPDTADLVTGADQLIRHMGAQIDKLRGATE